MALHSCFCHIVLKRAGTSDISLRNIIMEKPTDYVSSFAVWFQSDEQLSVIFFFGLQ